MNIYAAPIEIFQAAMPMIGCDVPTSIDDQSPEAVMARAGYEAIVSDALTQHGWSFALKTATLTKDAATNLSPAYSYPLPSDVLLPRFVQLNTERFEEFVIRGNKLWCDLDTTYLTLFYTYRAAETEWPGDFAWGIIRLLAAYVARGLLERTTLADNLEAQGMGRLHAARARDRYQHRGPQRDPDPTLVRAWRGTAALGALDGPAT